MQGKILACAENRSQFGVGAKTMRILPVMDLMSGQVVRGIAGRRQEYRPVVSQLTSSAEPLAVARAFREHFGLREIYLADLDALAGKPPALPLYAQLRADGFQLWVDAGVRQAHDVQVLADAGIEAIVAGLETLTGPETLRELCRRHSAERIIFSLDLRGGRPLASGAWETTDPWAIAERAIAQGIQRMVVLDLAQVGMGAGTGTEEFCRRLTTTYPMAEVYAGGGLRSAEDLLRLAECGVHGVLVASALHDGHLTRQDVKQFRFAPDQP